MRVIGVLFAVVAAAGLALATPRSAAAEVRILAFGDSLTYGSGLPPAEGFVPQLEAWLRANGAPDATVINGGVPGETSGEGLARIGKALASNPDAVIVALGANDLLRGLPTRALWQNLDGILAAIDRQGAPALLAGLPAPPTWRPDDRKAFRAAFRNVAERHDAIFVPSFFGGMSGQGMLGVRRMMQKDGIHPNAAGVAANVAAIGPSVKALVARARRAPAR